MHTHQPIWKAYSQPVEVHSAVLIGFRFNKKQQAILASAGVTTLSPDKVCSREDLDQSAHLIGVSLCLPEEERVRIEQLVKKKGILLKSLNENDMVTMITERFRRR